MKFLAAFLFVALSTHAVFGQWTQTSGPTGAYSHEMFYVSNYLFVNGNYGGVYRSADKGVTWQLIDNGLPKSYFCWAFDIDNTDLYMATSHGVYYSSDFGDSWISISDMSLVGFSIEAIGNEIFVGYHNGLLYYSPDHGDTWQTLTVNPQVTISTICKYGNRIWIGADQTGFRYSPDGGVNWLTVPLNILVTGIDASGGELFVSGNDWNNGGTFKIFRSGDQGVTWTQILSTGENNLSKTGFIKNGNEIFVSGASNYYYSANNGMSWSTHPLPSLFTFYPFSSIAIVDDGLLIAYGNGVTFSGDNGTTWAPRNTEFRNHIIDNIEGTENAIVSLSSTNGAFISTDHGDQWKQIHDPSLGFPLPYNIYAYKDAIVMSYTYNVYKSSDTADSWQQILTPDIGGLSSINAARIAGFEESLVATSMKGVYFSRNLGDTWNFLPGTTFGQYDLLKSYVQHDTVIVLTQNEMFISTNFGTSWQKKTAPDLPVDNLSINDINMDGPMITLATGNGMYKSLDFGLTWKKMLEFNSENIFDIEQVGDRLILATYSGIYVSGTNGIGWYAANDGLNGYIPNTLLVSDLYSYVGTRGQSVWRIATSDLLTPRELIYVGSPGVPIPQLTADCSTLTITNDASDVIIRWYKNGVPIPDQSDKILQSTGPGSYAASFENGSDIKMSAPVYIGEPNKEGVVIYNAVTANGDGKNDTYILAEELIGSKLMIINRWGEIVYSNDSYHNDWSPDQISPAQYFYFIESKCLGTFKGVLTVMSEP